MSLLSWSRCFAIAHVCYPTLILNIIVRCDVLSSVLLMSRNLCHDILLSFSRYFAIAYLFEADVSPSHMLVILLWLSMSLLGVMFYHLVFLHLWHVTLLLFSRCFTISFVCCFIWCFAILTVFVVLTKKHKPTRIYEPNYGCSDSLKRIRSHWGRAQPSTTFIFPTLFSFFFSRKHSLFSFKP